MPYAGFMGGARGVHMSARARSAAALAASLLGVMVGDAGGVAAVEQGTRAISPRPREASVVLMFTGDNLLGARMGEHIERNGEQYPYEKVSAVLRSADLLFGNLECPITDYPHVTPGKSTEAIEQARDYVFKASPKYAARILKTAGFDVLSLTNNHAMDYQARGLIQTIEELQRFNMIPVGAGRNALEAASARIVTKNGLRIGFLAYSMIVPLRSAAGASTAGINAHRKGFSEAMATAISQLRAKTDVVIVSYHWGEEGGFTPLPYQREVAKGAVEAGAQIVVGHHPHRIQGVEFYEDGVVFYSLGNFLFPGRSALVESFVARVELSGARVASVGLLPMWVRSGRPEPSTDPKLIRRIEQVCAPFGLRFSRAGEWLVATASREVREVGGHRAGSLVK
ncbi:MAG: hypothetical protein C4341_09770 [Armatimonadota bacterium]